MKVGTLVRWRSQGNDPNDFDDLGIVVYTPAPDRFDEYYVIQWVVEGTRSDHSPQMIEESLYESQLEVIR
jgi:hypothetical protein